MNPQLTPRALDVIADSGESCEPIFRERPGVGLRRWYVGSMNDGCFIIDQPPRQSHDYPDHDADVNCITGFPQNDEATFAVAQRICDSHNAAIAAAGGAA